METRELTREFQDAGLVIKAGEIPEEIYCIKATNRQALIDVINQFVNSAFFDGTKNKIYYLHVGFQGEGNCGGQADYKTEADIPYHSVPCPCGNPKHWLIKYEEDK